VPWLGLSAALAAFALLGFSDGVTFALLYLLPTTFPEVSGNVVAFGLALENFVQILIGSAIAIAFALIAAAPGYGAAWVFAGFAAVVFLPAFATLGTVPGPRAPGRSTGPA